jgi:signal transduction histidine kinase/Tfp pilus assembly protein PilF
MNNNGMKQIIYILFLLNSFSSIAQDFNLEERKKNDSLLTIWNSKELDDTARTDAYQSYIVNHFLYNSPDSAFILAQEYYEFAKQKKLKYRMSTALLLQGISKSFVNNYEEALHYYSRCLKFRITSGNQEGIASVLNNMGLVYFEQGDHSNALKYYLKSLKIEENLKNEKGIANSLNNIGLIYKEEGDYNTALKNYNRSLKIQIKLKNQMGESHALVNIGVVYLNQGNYEDALSSFEQALITNDGYEENFNANINYNIGSVQFDLGHYDTALGYINKALKTQVKLNNRLNESSSLNLIAQINFKQNSTLKSISFARRALKIAQEIGAKEEIQDAAQGLSKYYKAINRPSEALDMLILFMETKDEIQSENISNEIIRQSLKYKYDKKAAKDSLENAYLIEISQDKINNQREKKELAEQKNFYLYGGLFLTLIFGAFIYNRFKLTANQKSVIEIQKHTVDKANKELNQINEELLVKKNEIGAQKKIVQLQNKKLKKSLDTEKELGLLKTSFVSMASHQFKTPLAVIQSNAELYEMLANTGKIIEPEKFEKITGRIKGAIITMTNLIDDVLVLGKATSGNVPYTPEDVDLVSFCKKMVEEFNTVQMDGRSIGFVTEGEPYTVQLDPKLLRHSLSNLISNAFKYSVGKENPELRIHFKSKEVVFFVKDYGLGIPKEEHLKLFTPFFRANNVRDIKGSGLGLNITKEYVEINKGQITATSILGEGSCFEITFKRQVK